MPSSMRCAFLVIALLWPLIGQTVQPWKAPACTPVDVTSPDQRARLLHHVCYLAALAGEPGWDASHPKELEGDRRWQSANGRDLVFTHSEATYWVRLQVANPTDSAGLWFLKLNYALLDDVTFWMEGGDQDTTIATGDRRPFHSRGIDYRHYLLPVTLEGGETRTLTLKIRSSGALNVPLALETPEEVIIETNHLTLTNGLFYGAVMIFAVFNLLLFFSSGTRYYFYNTFYMVSMGLFLFAMGGFANQYFWPESPHFANTSIPMLLALSALSMTLFGRSFLEVGTGQRLASRMLTAQAWLSVVCLLVAFTLPYSVSISVNTLFGLVVIGSLFVIGVMRWRQGCNHAKWYTLSWSLMVLGTFIYSLAAFGYLADFLAREVFMQGAIGAQVILLNYAIVQRWRNLNQKLLEVEHNTRHALELKVHERTAQLRDTMRDLEKANRKLSDLSLNDCLTGLHNRRYLDRMLPDLCAEARRTQQPVSMILMDADHFKQINDTWGHSFGDECLKRIADVLTRHIRRPRDLVARFGGEEFALVLPNTDAQGALNVCDRILEDMSTSPIKAPNNEPIRITLSAGVAELSPGEGEPALFARADEALYQAKALGRNRTEVSAVAAEH